MENQRQTETCTHTMHSRACPLSWPPCTYLLLVPPPPCLSFRSDPQRPLCLTCSGSPVESQSPDHTAGNRGARAQRGAVDDRRMEDADLVDLSPVVLYCHCL
jgi:hypothetical protein